MRRTRFIIAFGALATASATTVATALSQITIVPAGSPNWRQATLDLGNQAALYRFRLNYDDGGAFCTAAVLPKSTFRAEILANTDKSSGLTLVQDLARSSGAAVAINGGFFNGAFSPEGLLTVDGRSVGVARSDWLGSLTVDRAGDAEISTSASRSAAYAVQGNPMLIEPGGNMGIHREDHLLERRTVIAQSGDMIVAMVTSPVSLFRLAYALMEHPETLALSHIDAALNLSGGATTSFYAKLLDGSEITEAAGWPNRDVIAFYARSARRQTS